MPSKRKSISLAPAWLTTTGSARNWSAWVRFEQPSATISRLETEHANLEDQAAHLAPEDEQLEAETHTLEGKRTAALGRSQSLRPRHSGFADRPKQATGLSGRSSRAQRLRCSLPAKQPIPTGRICWIACAPHVPCAKSTAAP